MSPTLTQNELNPQTDSSQKQTTSSRSVIRTVHNRENPYVLINKKAAQDPNLSLKAVGLLIRCMTKPDDWRFSIKQMILDFKEGRNAIYGAIDELIENNYAMRVEYKCKDEHGRFSGSYIEYVFFEFQVTEEEKAHYVEKFKKCFRHSGFGDPGNRPLLNTERRLNTEKNKQQAKPPKPKGAKAPLSASFAKKKVRHVDIWDRRHQLYKDLDDEEFELLKQFGENYPHKLTNPMGFVRRCLENGWHKQKVVHTNDYEITNQWLYSQALDNHPQLKREIKETKWGLTHEKSSRDLKWTMVPCNFKEELDKIIQFSHFFSP